MSRTAAKKLDSPSDSPATSFTRKIVVAFLVVIATGCELLMLWVLMGRTPWDVGLWFMLPRIASVAACWLAAHLLSPLRNLDAAALLITATFVPVFGPAIAWSFALPRKVAADNDDDAVNAHAHFENLEDSDGYERNTLTGEFSTDLAREVSTVSYAQILRQGTLQKRRNLLRSLARIGTPAHVAVIRSCLYDANHELRLCAHAELNQLARQHEAKITKLREAAEAADADGSAKSRHWAELSRACHRYASSGVFDAEMSEFWLERAAEYSSMAFALAPEDPRMAREAASILVHLGRADDAELALEAAAMGNESLADAALRAEIAFHNRDFTTVNRVAMRFVEELVPVPSWMEAITGKRTSDILQRRAETTKP